MLSTAELDYELDPRAIATQPAEPRDSARMLVVHRVDDRIEHRRVRDLPEYLRAGDRLVLNSTRVMPARLKLRRIGDGRETEGLLEEGLGDRRWAARIRHARRLRAGDRLELMAPRGPGEGVAEGAVVRVLGRRGEASVLEFEGVEAVDAIVRRCGWTPLPPYILKARQESGDRGDDRADRDHYQTVFAVEDERPSIAAPTAGLHFTPELLRAAETLGVTRLDVELQVGAGTFKPVEAEFLEQHRMHSEWYRVPGPALAALRQTEELRRCRRARVIAVGTTSVRVLESLPDPLPSAPAAPAVIPAAPPRNQHGISGETTLMILPGTPIRRVDALLTNFHLPRSTLLALVGAFVGLERLKRLYETAQREGYRFYSFGDAMLIL
ncbi:MAG: tRNA preQ1(34) S-adenosylmethionine ribosyltransferase-isomerase QueA [Phycisphaerae bacterium]|nr:tRNA preQ1(34) S-adenosylmethionine ribosyltransferase-isomerase QueA [Phycisphaerae bacterium]